MRVRGVLVQPDIDHVEEEEEEKCQVEEEEKSGSFKIAEACQTSTLYLSIYVMMS